jgi:hypothetical protein
VTPFVCKNDIKGGVRISDVSSPQFALGDREASFGGVNCEGNTIHGTVRVSNTRGLELEDNTIIGSVLISDSVLDLHGNTINGSLRCSNTVLLPGEPGDTANDVHGAIHCP